MSKSRLRLRRSGVAAIAAACVLSLTGTAEAKTRDYDGPIGPSGAISFKLRGTPAKGKVLELSWYRLPVECGSRDEITSGSLNYPVPVKGKAFEAHAVLGNSKRPKAEAIIEGSIKGKSASGSIIVRGSKLPVSDGTDDCDSGKHPWNATG